MVNRELVSTPLSIAHEGQSPTFASPPALPALITKAASKQTYYTIRFLVDRERITDAYRAYAYFRWVDDWLDGRTSNRTEYLAFVTRQQTLIDCAYHNYRAWPRDLTVEEQMLIDLIQTNPQPDSGLRAYIQNLMAVMQFDAHRRGKLITQQELADYTRWLATGVTEAMHYFIGHDDYSPQTAARYLAVTGAHITHMLRDTVEDVAAGYFNIPREFLEALDLDPCAVQSDGYMLWVKDRVQLARSCFDAGKSYLAQVKNLRCRLAGYAYMARFQAVLDVIERDGYRLRPDYAECKSLSATLRMIGSVFSMTFQSSIRGTA